MFGWRRSHGPFGIIGFMDFSITRDGHGVPHVRGETAADAWAGMGYACTQDRLFQLDYDRRRACGRWAEIAGAGAVGGDVLARRLGLAAAAQRDVAVMSAPARAAFEAYAGGVNAAIADGALPLPGGTGLSRGGRGTRSPRTWCGTC